MKIRVAIPCYSYKDIELNVDDELAFELENDVVEGLEKDERYRKDIERQLESAIDFVDSLDSFEVNCDEEILYWKP